MRLLRYHAALCCILTAALTTTSSAYELDFKAIVRKAAAIPCALAAHYALEFASTGMHEAGHATAHWIQTGNTSGVQLYSELDWKNPFFWLHPWGGITHYSTNSSIEAIDTAAGPITGIATTALQIKALKAVDLHLSEKYPDQWNESIAQQALKELVWLRKGRIVGESLYGLLPTIHGGAQGDGCRLWKTVVPGIQPIKINLPAVTLLLMVAGTLLPPAIKKLSNAQSSSDPAAQPNESEPKPEQTVT